MIKLLDCTLRDGGYINNWDFGHLAITEIIDELEKTHVDIIEIGFLKDETYSKDRTIFNEMSQITSLLPHKKKNIEYAAMIEVFSPIPIEKLPPRDDTTVDIIRVMVWKTMHDEDGKEIDALDAGYEYCKGVIERGYKLCVQPARVDQYTDEEFISMIKRFAELDPMAIYVVDSWGTRQIEDILHYVDLANEHLKPEIAIGYHGHNNMMQAFGIATTLVNRKMDRLLMVDASIYGMGRCAGNLNLETFAKYLNDTEGVKYELTPMYKIYEKYIRKIYENHKWGYSIQYFLTAVYNCHPNYAQYLALEKKINPSDFEQILKGIVGKDKILYTKELADYYANKYYEDSRSII